MCAECDRLEADRQTGTLQAVAGRMVADYIAGHFSGARQADRDGTWDKAAVTLSALANGADPRTAVTLRTTGNS